MHILWSDMHVFATGSGRAVRQLLELRRQAQQDRAPRVVLRIQGILMSLEGHSTGDIAAQLKIHRSTIPTWIEHWNRYGAEGLWEGHRSGRPPGLDAGEQEKLRDILDSGPVAYGLETGIWTSPVVSQVIREEFDQDYHPGHVRKLLCRLGYSVQRPATRLVQADAKQKRKWVRYTYPRLKKRPTGRRADRIHRRGFFSTDPHFACDLGAARQPTANSHPGRTQHPKDFWRGLSEQRPIFLSPSGRLFSVGNLFGVCRSGAAAGVLPARPPDLSHSGQCLLSQEAGNLGLFLETQAASGGVSVAALLARTQRSGTDLELHAQARNAQSFF